MTKAVIDLSGYTAAELSPAAHTIHDEMTANAATFPSPPMTMAAFATDLTDFVWRAPLTSRVYWHAATLRRR